MPNETEAVVRTQIFAISYLVLHVALIFAAVIGMRKKYFEIYEIFNLN